MVRQVIVDVFLSVDGWAGSDNLPGYFGYFGPELGHWIDGELAKPQLQLFGRRTYELLSGLPPEAADDGTRRTLELDKIVFSRTLDATTWPNTTVVRDDAVQHVRALTRTDGPPLRTVGSLSIARQLLDADLVDRLRLMVFPLLAGPDGREPFFEGVAPVELEVADERLLDGRVRLVEYRPTGRDVPRS